MPPASEIIEAVPLTAPSTTLAVRFAVQPGQAQDDRAGDVDQPVHDGPVEPVQGEPRLHDRPHHGGVVDLVHVILVVDQGMDTVHPGRPARVEFLRDRVPVVEIQPPGQLPAGERQRDRERHQRPLGGSAMARVPDQPGRAGEDRLQPLLQAVRQMPEVRQPGQPAEQRQRRERDEHGRHAAGRFFRRVMVLGVRPGLAVMGAVGAAVLAAEGHVDRSGTCRRKCRRRPARRGPRRRCRRREGSGSPR